MQALLRNAINPLLMTITAIVFANCNQGCHLFQSAKDLEKQYNADLKACVDKSETRLAAEECVYDVNEAYGLCKPSKMPELKLCRED